MARVSERWLRVRDAYGGEIAPGNDDALLLAITVVVEDMTYERY